jgi:hypothetical protein
MFDKIFTSPDLMIELIASFVSIFGGLFAALQAEEWVERRRKNKRARIVVRELREELNINHRILTDVYEDFAQHPWGKSFYISTLSWENANTADLPDIISPELADIISDEYFLLMRIRYYIDLLTKLWFSPSSIDGYEAIRNGFRDHLMHDMEQVFRMHPYVTDALDGTGNLSDIKARTSEIMMH